jgi:hypothetical protein
MVSRYISLFIVFFFISAQLLTAQMFSVDSENSKSNNENAGFGYNSLYMSVINAEFDFQGVGDVAGFIPLNFSGNIFAVGFENEFTLVEVSLGSNFTGLSNNSEYFGIHFKNMRPLFRFGSRAMNVQIPIGIAFDYTRASDTRSTISANNLNQSGLMAGSGLKYVIDNTKWYFSAGGDFFYGVSFADGSAFRGNTTRFNVPVRFMLRDLIGSKDLTFGATYLFKSIDVTNDPNERFDYDLSGFQAHIGLSF